MNNDLEAQLRRATDMLAQLRRATDMLQLMSNQRAAAQNETLQVGAELLAAKREIEELKKKLADRDAPELPMQNGHAAEVEAHA